MEKRVPSETGIGKVGTSCSESVKLENTFFYFFSQLFLLVGGYLLYNIVVVFAIH